MPDPGSTDPPGDADRLARWFGRHRLDEWLMLIERFWSGELAHLVSITTNLHGYRQHRTPGAMPALAREHLRAQSQVPGINPPGFFADFGTISLPRYWGGCVHWPEQTCPYIDPVASEIERALKVHPLPACDPDMDAAQALALYHELRQDLDTDLLWLRSIDAQGPLNTAAMVLDQQELMVAMVEQPHQVHALLEHTVGHLIEVIDHLQRESGGRVCGNIWPYTFLPLSRGLSFTEDFMPLLSVDLYRQYALPYLRHLSQTFGSLLIHCCGQWGRHATTLADSDVNVTGVEFHYPFTRIEQLTPLADRAAFIPYIALEHQDDFESVTAYYRHLLDTHGSRCRFWFAWPDDTEEARAFLEQVGAWG